MALRKSTKHQNGAARIMRKLKILGLGSDLDGGNKEAKPRRQSSLGSLFSWKYFWIIVAFHRLFTKYFVKAKKSLENVSLGGSK